ncbi:MAG TPA: hypothetical protein VFU98_01330 [Microlunatus sp.]|nr:hypothetical protein [Microlunatus sp.]
MPEDRVPGDPSTTDAAQDSSTGSPGLTERQAALLLRMLRVAYPHPDFPDAPYERTAKAVQEAGLTDSVLLDGLDDLDARADGDFLALDDQRATAVLEQIDTTDFFRRVHATTVVALYDDHEVWDLLGYEGSSFEKGGYLERGFDDLDWLPRPRIEEYEGEPRVELVTDRSAS